MQYSIVIPTYNSKRLHTVIEELHHFFKEKGAYEIIVVNDGGKIIEELQGVKLLSFKQNCGKNYALYEGFKEAKGEYIITLDDDGQHEVVEIQKLIDYKSHDIIIGKYTSENSLGSWLKHITERVLFNKNNIRFTPFKLIKRRVIDLAPFENRIPFISTIISHSTKDIIEVEVTVNKIRNQQSRFSLSNKVIFYRNLIASKGNRWANFVGVNRKKPIILK